MAKRIGCLVLLLALMLSFLPQIALAAPQKQILTLRQSGYMVEPGSRAVTVYTNGYGDILMSGEDLEECTGFLYENDGKSATFTRNSKRISVKLSSGKYTPFLGDSELSVRNSISEPMQVDGQWYFSTASLLPWLNVTCVVESGDLVIVADDYSFWDIWGRLDLSEYDVSYGDLIEEFEWDSRVVKAMKLMDKGVGKKFLEAIHYTDEYDGSVEDYFDLLEGLLLNGNHCAYLADSIHDANEFDLNVFGIIFGDFGPIFTAFQVVNDGAYYASQYAAFTANQNDKMQLMESMILNRKNYSAQLEDACIMVENTYTSWWQGILNKFVLNLDKYLVDKIKDKAVNNPIGKAILLAVDVSTKEIQNLNTRISLMAPTYNLFIQGKKYYEGASSHYTSVRQARTHGILSLYAAGENLRTLVTYSDKHNKGKLADTYERMAKECDMWINELTAASLSQMNDSHCYWEADGDDEGDKSIYSNKLLDMYEDIRFHTPPTGGLEMVEYAMLADFMEYQPLIEKTWHVGGNLNDSMIMVVYGTMEMSGQLRPFQYEAHLPSMQSRLFDLGDMPQMSDPDLTDITISGDSKTLLEKLDNYMTHRQNYYASETADLNGDGRPDRVYAIVGSANLWMDNMELHTPQHEEFNIFGNDPQLTLVAAESASGGIRVRVMRMFVQGQPKWTLEGGTLTVGGTVYEYTPDGEDPFVCEDPQYPSVDTENIPLNQMLLLTQDELIPLLTDYAEFTSSDGEEIFGEGTFRGSQLEVTFKQINGQYRATTIEVLFGEETISVTSGLTSDDSVEKVEKTLQPTLTWKLTDSEDEGDAVCYFHSSFYYDTVTQSAWYVTVRTREPWENNAWAERSFAGIQFFYSESLNEEIPDWLLSSYQ